jgi:hypothetical protein
MWAANHTPSASQMWVAIQTLDAYPMVGADQPAVALTLAAHRTLGADRGADRALGADPQRASVLVRGDRRKARSGWQPAAFSATGRAAGRARSAPPVPAAPSGWGAALS